jgi:ParB/RepB/Spo0J family partition protein
MMTKQPDLLPDGGTQSDGASATKHDAAFPADAPAPTTTTVGLSDLTELGPVNVIDPALCLPFAGAPRAGYRIDLRRDAALIDDIRTNGVIEPLVVTKMEGRLVILSGNRRHAVVCHLRAEGVEVALPVRACQFRGLDAVAFATAINVGRAAPTAMELARSVAWTRDHVETSQSAVARALKMNEAKVSHLCTLATLPEWITDIVTDPEALSENAAALLAPALADPEMHAVMERRAAELKAGNVTLAGPAAVRFLKTGARAAAGRELRGPSGTSLGSIKRDLRGGIVLRLSPAWRKVEHRPADLLALVSAELAETMRELD